MKCFVGEMMWPLDGLGDVCIGWLEWCGLWMVGTVSVLDVWNSDCSGCLEWRGLMMFEIVVD